MLQGRRTHAITAPDVAPPLTPAGQARTRVSLDHLGWPAAEAFDEEPQWAACVAYFEAAWAKVLEALADALA
jgi:hypothetical protein